MSEWLTDAVQWGSTRIAYQYQHAARNTLAISVHPDLTVTVRVPLGATRDLIRQRVLKRAAWIEKTRQERELYLPKQPPRRYVGGETHRYLGRQYRLKIMQGTEKTVSCSRGQIQVSLGDPADCARIKFLVEGWYDGRAREIIGERYSVCAAKMARHGIAAPEPTIRRMVSRWGSCSPRGRINLNVELVKAPKECIDYVILHELCHLKERHHGPRYWALLRRLMPNCAEVRARLNQIANQ